MWAIPTLLKMEKMIIINSSDNEFSTFLVCKWIKHLKGDFSRINKFDYSRDTIKVELSNDEFCFRFNDLVINSNSEDKTEYTYWYRRSAQINYSSFNSGEMSDNLNEIISGVNKELVSLNAFILNSLHRKARYNINYQSKANLNRLETLEKAKENGLLIPSYLITNSRIELLQFKQRHKKIAIKPISEVITLRMGGKPFTQYTKILDEEMIDELGDLFFPSLFTQYIEKSYEIRSFYLDGKFHSMAMFTQQRSQTVEDFRKYNYSSPVRVVPYKIPLKTEQQLYNLFESIGLNSGSVDLIKPKNESNLVFLEINPVGQFGMVSHPCNYNLEKLIAQKLHNES
jgi:ATP-GRASP peptide maturase of grasp-with-spasm system